MAPRSSRRTLTKTWSSPRNTNTGKSPASGKANGRAGATRMHKRKRGDNDSDNDDEYSPKAAVNSVSTDEIQPYCDSDALDEDPASDSAGRKPKANKDSSRKKHVTKKGDSIRSPLKKHRKSKPKDDSDEDQEDEFGGEVVGVIVKAPETGRVPPGQISQNTFDFLNKLKDPKCNDREWFKLHEPVYRLAENEWKDFIEAFTEVLSGADPQIPPLPPKDVIHRIYRDIRFSNDKTPYKTYFSASFSRSGRKGVFAHYHMFVLVNPIPSYLLLVITQCLSPNQLRYSPNPHTNLSSNLTLPSTLTVSPGGKSFVGAGSYCPGRSELANIRTNIQRDSTRFRRIISSSEFVRIFGEPKPRTDGTRQNIFGMEDELKVAPKGVDKQHKDIDLLKCRSFAVLKYIEDDEVLDPDFTQKLTGMITAMRPFVHCLNDMMTVNGGSSSGGDEDSDGEEGEEGV